ncbi:MAG: ABC transporter ATP-binding protein [Betaproteobacteria bacterium]
MTPLLKIKNTVSGYDEADVLAGVSLDVAEGEITCLLGANGAGKTTLIRTLLGLNPIRSGKVFFKSTEITGWPTHEIARLGITCVPEGRRVFPSMTVLENLRMGGYLNESKSDISERLDYAFTIFPKLKERVGQLAGTMSGGEQAMLTIARGLMGNPELIIFDEPSLGLSPLFVKENFRVIQEINGQGISVLLVEQNVRQTLAISHVGHVLAQGKIITSGNTETLRESDALKAAYFGG